MSGDMVAPAAIAKLRKHHGALFAEVPAIDTSNQVAPDAGVVQTLHAMCSAVQEAVVWIADNLSAECDMAVDLIAGWIEERALVRVMASGLGRAAALVATRRIAMAGARVQLDDHILPMAGPLQGGGVVAVFGADDEPDLVERLARCRRANRDLQILAVGLGGTSTLEEHCDVLVRIVPARLRRFHLIVDVEAHVLSHVLDSLVVQALATLGQHGEGSYDIDTSGLLDPSTGGSRDA